MKLSRRRLFRGAVLYAGMTGAASARARGGRRRPSVRGSKVSEVRITRVRITPIALPDPPILAASGCHGPYFLRNVIEIETDAGVTGIGETWGGEAHRRDLLEAARRVAGRSVFAYRGFREEISAISTGVYSGLELACLDASGRLTGRRLCELLGGPVREQVEFAAYLFYRYAADHAKLINDRRIVDDRGRGDEALDHWGEVRSAEAMAAMAQAFREKWGFRVFKLKGGVLTPGEELRTLRLMSARFRGQVPLRIDPNGRWTMATALRIGQQLRELPLEYYEDPVPGQQAMAEVRRKTGLVMSTNSCVTRFHHIRDAIKNEPIDVVLGDHHGWGGIVAFQELGRICATLGWGLSQHSNSHAGITMAAMTHVGAVVPQLTYAGDTHYLWLVEGADIIEGPNLPIREGKIEVPKGAGLGVDLDRDKLARAHEVYRKCGMKRRDDAATMRRIEPGWKRNLL